MKAFKKELTMLGVMIALAVITAILNPSFLGADNLRNNVRHISLSREPSGYWSGVVTGAGAGTRYSYRVNGEGHFPDPASRTATASPPTSRCPR